MILEEKQKQFNTITENFSIIMGFYMSFLIILFILMIITSESYDDMINGQLWKLLISTLSSFMAIFIIVMGIRSINLNEVFAILSIILSVLSFLFSLALFGFYIYIINLNKSIKSNNSKTEKYTILKIVYFITLIIKLILCSLIISFKKIY